ncbi:hypothetical protein KKI24_28440 [bacterium]|nr:hypothetical protein [bacterium]
MNEQKKMNPIYKITLLFSILLVLSGCEKESQPWNPVFEETSFDYINTEIDRSLVLIDEAYAEAAKSKQPSIQEKLQHAKARLLQIKDYYVPLTTVRQKIYDAERYYQLNNIKKSKSLLEDAKSIVASLEAATTSENFDKVILEIISMINEVMATFDGDSKTNTTRKMKKAGEHINMILLKGDLVLSEINFEK